MANELPACSADPVPPVAAIRQAGHINPDVIRYHLHPRANPRIILLVLARSILSVPVMRQDVDTAEIAVKTVTFIAITHMMSKLYRLFLSMVKTDGSRIEHSSAIDSKPPR